MTKNADLYITEIEQLSLTLFGDTTVQRVLRASDRNARVRRRQQDVDNITYRMPTLAASWQSIRGMYVFADDGALFYFTRGTLPKEWVRDRRRALVRQDEPADRAIPALLRPTAAEFTVGDGGQPVFSHIRLIKNNSTGKKIGDLKIDV